MTETERAIWTTLVELDEAVKSVRAANPKPDLLGLFNRIEQLAAELPEDTASDLRHYLRKKSYEKARRWLEGRDPENARGNCGHV